MYWANTVISTVGFGDFLPHTTPSILLAMGLQVMGPVLGAILVAGILPLFDKEFAEGFSSRVSQMVEKIAGDVDEIEADVESVRTEVSDIESDIDSIAHGERSQDRVLAEIAREVRLLRRQVADGARGNGAPGAERPKDPA